MGKLPGSNVFELTDLEFMDDSRYCNSSESKAQLFSPVTMEFLAKSKRHSFDNSVRLSLSADFFVDEILPPGIAIEKIFILLFTWNNE